MTTACAENVVTKPRGKPRLGARDNARKQQSVKAFSINEFCADHGISRSTYYSLRKKGKAPQEMRLTDRWLISVEAAAEWRRQREADAKASAEKVG